MLPTPEAGEGREYVEKPPPEEPPTFLQEGTGPLVVGKRVSLRGVHGGRNGLAKKTGLVGDYSQVIGYFHHETTWIVIKLVNDGWLMMTFGDYTIQYNGEYHNPSTIALSKKRWI